MIFAIFTATLPTLEFTEEQGNFNNLGTRDQSFWGQVLEKLSSGNTVFNTREAEVMHRDLSSDRLKIQLGWVIPVIWIGCAWALMALIMLALVPLYRPVCHLFILQKKQNFINLNLFYSISKSLKNFCTKN